MKHKMTIRLLICYLLFFVLGISLFLAVIPKKVTDYFIEKTGQELLIFAKSLEQQPGLIHCSSDRSKDASIIRFLDIVNTERRSEIWLVDHNGQILLTTSSRYSSPSVTSVPDFSVEFYRETPWLTGDFYGVFPKDMLSAIFPVTSEEMHSVDFIMIHYPMARIEKSVDYFMEICIFILASIYLLSLILPLAFHFFFYRPLKELTKISLALLDGDLRYPIPETEDEFAPLRSNLKFMAQDMAHVSEYQRVFLTNLSHDFRSPLTSIKGYAEAILDGTIPPESQNRYLEIILTETARLERLTHNIVTASNLERSGINLELSVFDIHDTIRACAASMEIQCRKKDLQIEFSLSGGVQNVRADQEKIQQVIYNLLDNAIKFSNPHSSITISTMKKIRYIYVSVKDNGCGIPPDQLSKIWTRFYKSDLSRGKDKLGSGLGLSIVREIIRAHGQNINVTSTEGNGSEFTFSLERA